MPLATMEIYLYEQVSVRAGTITREFRRELRARCSRSSRKYTFRSTYKKKKKKKLEGVALTKCNGSPASLSSLLSRNKIGI